MYRKDEHNEINYLIGVLNWKASEVSSIFWSKKKTLPNDRFLYKDAPIGQKKLN